MSHNTANTMMFITWFIFVGALVIFADTWFWLLVFITPTFQTDKELTAKQGDTDND